MSDTSTKRAEEIAYNLHLSGVSGSTWRATEGDASNMLRALAAERDALRSKNEKLRAALKTARRNALEEAVSRVKAYSQNETARNILTIIYALGEKE